MFEWIALLSAESDFFCLLARVGCHSAERVCLWCSVNIARMKTCRLLTSTMSTTGASQSFATMRWRFSFYSMAFLDFPDIFPFTRWHFSFSSIFPFLHVRTHFLSMENVLSSIANVFFSWKQTNFSAVLLLNEQNRWQMSSIDTRNNQFWRNTLKQPLKDTEKNSSTSIFPHTFIRRSNMPRTRIQRNTVN